MAWRILLCLLLLTTGSQCLYEYHVDKARDLFVGYGTAFKFPSTLVLTSKRLIKKPGLLSSYYKLESFKEWDLVFTINFENMFKGSKDGMVINLSPNEVNSQVAAYDTNNSTELGFLSSLLGLAVIIRHPEEGEGVGPNTVSVYARHFDKKIKFLPSTQTDVFGKKSKFNKNFELNPSTMSLKVYIRYNAKKLSVMATTEPSRSPTTIYTREDLDFRDFFMSLSAVATEHFVGVKVPDVYFKSDKQNTDIVYFEKDDFNEKNEIFNYIHHMHDVLNDEIASQYLDTNVTEISDEKIIDQMIESQTQALEYLRPAAKIIRQTEQEVNSVFNYLNNYRNVSKGYFVKVVGQVTKMLKDSSRVFKEMEQDIDKLNAKFSKNQLIALAEKTHLQMKQTKSKLENVDIRLREAKSKIDNLKSKLQTGDSFIRTFDSLVKTLPDNLKIRLDMAAEHHSSSLLSTLVKIVAYLLLVVVVLGLLFIIWALGSASSGKQRAI